MTAALNFRALDEYVAAMRARHGDRHGPILRDATGAPIGNGWDADAFHATIREQTEEALAERDALGFVIGVGNERALSLVFDNLVPLRDAGMYEAALLHALTGTRTNHAHWSIAVLRWMCAQADREKLRAAGAPLPGPGPFRLYRGVCGHGHTRKVRGLHWTATASTAAWFATRFPGAERDPAVYVANVKASAVLAYINDRHEDDYLVELPKHVRPVRLAAFPDAVRPDEAAA